MLFERFNRLINGLLILIPVRERNSSRKWAADGATIAVKIRTILLFSNYFFTYNKKKKREEENIESR